MENYLKRACDINKCRPPRIAVKTGPDCEYTVCASVVFHDIEFSAEKDDPDWNFALCKVIGALKDMIDFRDDTFVWPEMCTPAKSRGLHCVLRFCDFTEGRDVEECAKQWLRNHREDEIAALEDALRIEAKVRDIGELLIVDRTTYEPRRCPDSQHQIWGSGECLGAGRTLLHAIFDVILTWIADDEGPIQTGRESNP